MKGLVVVTMISLLVLPILRNGLTFLHYVSAHTHVLCLSNKDHNHVEVSDCESLCIISLDQTHDNELPANQQENHDIKLWYLSNKSFQSIELIESYKLRTFNKVYNAQNFISKIFHPPII